MMKAIRRKLLSHTLLLPTLMVVTLTWGAHNVSAQTDPTKTGVADGSSTGLTVTDGPTFMDYKGVQIGMNADEVRQKLGKPELTDETGDLFLISDVEMVQVVYKKDGKVSAISITYSSKNDSAPTAVAVLGEDVTPSADGRVYKLIRYPAAGYWVAYSRTAGDASVVSVTMKQMQD